MTGTSNKLLSLQQEQPDRCVNSAQSSPVSSSEYDDSSSSSHSSSWCDDELGVYDVICGRHKAAFNNIGNRRFRVTVYLAQLRYTGALTRKEKSAVIKSIAELVHSNGGRFLQCQKRSWVELSEKQSHEKVGHALRDMAVSSAAKQESFDKRGEVKTIPKPSKSKMCIKQKSIVRNSVHDDFVKEIVTYASGPCTKPLESASKESSLIEPLPWWQPSIAQDQDVLDSAILSWLSDESDTILQTF